MGLKFSQRIGKTPVRETLQVEGMDKGLENGLWNCIYLYLWEVKESFYKWPNQDWPYNFYKKILVGSYHVRLDWFLNLRNDEREREVRNIYWKADWAEKYDLIEFIVETANEDIWKIKIVNNKKFIARCNETLQKHQSAYRIINNQVTPIISDLEIQTIETALENPSQAVTTHLDTALKYLSARQNPDYRNSVKEAISAVESYCNSLAGVEKGKGVEKALAILERQQGLDKGLKKVFSNLYGYTSNTGGIRHKLKEDDAVITQAEARFMLIACSAFVNYLQDTVGE